MRTPTQPIPDLMPSPPPEQLGRLRDKQAADRGGDDTIVDTRRPALLQYPRPLKFRETLWK